MPRKTVYPILFTLAGALIFASTTAAHSIDIGQRAKIGNGPEVKPGTYKLEVVKTQNTADVSFYHDGDLVTTVPATLAQEGSKCEATEVHSENVAGLMVITKIRLAGTRDSLVFRSDAVKTD